MTLELAIKYSQGYRFLADAFLYPEENWLEDLPYMNKILEGMELQRSKIPDEYLDLNSLQDLYRQTFGLTGSLCYETEYGLPHEFRQSQELADIAGFYQAFGFQIGGRCRERPDHLAVEFEYMHLLCLKEAKALSSGGHEEARLCMDTQRSFLKDHLGAWIGLFSQALNTSSSKAQVGSVKKNLYQMLGETANFFVIAHANCIGADLAVRSLSNVLPTPLGPEMSCGDCSLSERIGNKEY